MRCLAFYVRITAENGSVEALPELFVRLGQPENPENLIPALLSRAILRPSSAQEGRSAGVILRSRMQGSAAHRGHVRDAAYGPSQSRLP